MAEPKHKQHDLSVDGQDFQYAVRLLKSRKDGGFNIDLTVKSAKTKGARLLVKDLHAGQLQDLFPGQVAELIRLARIQGWQPELKGSDFILKLDTDPESVNLIHPSVPGEIQLIAVIELDPATTVPLDTLSDLQIQQFYSQHFADWLSDPESRQELLENMIEYAPYIPGGFWLMQADTILSRPGCCCGLETIFDWEAVTDASQGSLWVGHGTDDYVSFEKGLKLISLNFDQRLEIILTLADYQTIVSQARQQIHVFISRSAPILNQLFTITTGPDLAQAMIDKTLPR